MASNDLALEFLVDPELIIPDKGYETNEDFWLRMCLVPDYAPIVTLGLYTRALFDSFIDESLDDICTQVSSFLSNPDIYSLYAMLNQLPDCTGKTRERIIELTEDDYCPRYGSSDNRHAIQCDLNEAESSYVLSESAVWKKPCGESHATMDSLIITNVYAGKPECIRTYIKSNPTYSILQELAKSAYPKLQFCEETWSTTRKLAGDERENALLMATIFEALNDHALDVWRDNDNNHDRINQMEGFHLSCSPENGLTDNNNKRINERRFRLAEESFEMSWHAKLFHNRNRVYFVVDIPRDRIVIGGCTEHFKTR